MHLRGIVYYGGFHYNVRILRRDGSVWFHDGLTTGINTMYEGQLDTFSEEGLKYKEERYATVLIYSAWN
ncbi:hypothetical protein JAAARDRAFT_130548 [Jaapia argillacea MUCL 33604]|uniref:USP domain-containing protein n=1 Tax=Jaapia argillacea MUCL 33604 TaxID=933084 RepID=A0A067PRF2_9AGAM|nr:hypothetical protein JAAARDRAFT_130548 [Jaapia argillacea MUCL 33604]